MAQESTQREFIKKLQERNKLFVQTHVWPISQGFNYQGWLRNFNGSSEEYLAAKILSGVLLYSELMQTSLLASSVGRAICCLAKERNRDLHLFMESDVVFHTIRGEDASPASSGSRILTKLKDELGISATKILDAQQLQDKLTNTKDRSLCVVICDDFVGTGEQCCEYLTRRPMDDLGRSLYEYVCENEHELAFVPMIANRRGFDEIRREMPQLRMFPTHVLGDEYNLFSESCICWEGDSEVAKAGIDLILSKSAQLDIPDDGSKESVRGFLNQGLLVGFESGFPDAAPALFYTTRNGWTPLKARRI